MLAYEQELQLIKDNVKIVWENLGEGLSGDYNEDDPEDENLLRFSVYVKKENEWEAVEDASYCTYVEANTDTDTLKNLLQVLMNEFYPVLHDDPEASVKRLAERMSWISAKTAIAPIR